MNENQNIDRDDLIARHLCGELNEAEKEQLCKLLDSDPRVRKLLVDEAEFLTQVSDALRTSSEVSHTNASMGQRSRSSHWPTLAKALLAIAAAALVIMSLQLVNQKPQFIAESEPVIAKITGVSGPLRWTGNGGRVSSNLVVGTELPGGTIDGLAPDSWFELEFEDGSQVVISGDSMLTFSDFGQKELHLKAGTISASVNPQPAGKPMLIHTRSAILEVLGTKFDVDAELSSTVLNVSEGKVRVRRLSDGSAIDVPADHRVVASAERAFELERVPNSVNSWKRSMKDGPFATHGVWSPATEKLAANLKTVPYTLDSGKTIYTVGIGVSPRDAAPVVVKPNSRVRVRGYVGKAKYLYFGMTVHKVNGDFAGRFQSRQTGKLFANAGEFEVELNVDDYKLDPSLANVKDEMANKASGHVVRNMWFHSLYDQAGLAITEVELIGPE